MDSTVRNDLTILFFIATVLEYGAISFDDFINRVAPECSELLKEQNVDPWSRAVASMQNK